MNLRVAADIRRLPNYVIIALERRRGKEDCLCPILHRTRAYNKIAQKKRNSPEPEDIRYLLATWKTVLKKRTGAFSKKKLSKRGFPYEGGVKIISSTVDKKQIHAIFMA